MKYIFKCLILFILFFEQNTFAQQVNIQDSIWHNGLKQLPKLMFNITPMAVVEPIRYLQGGVEYRLKNYWYIHHEVGWCFSYFSRANAFITNKKGIRLQNTIRYYIPNNKDLSKDIRTFVGLEFLFKKEKYTSNELYEIDGAMFSQALDIPYMRTVYGISVITGIKVVSQKSPITIDLIGGVGIRHRQIIKQVPIGAEPARDLRSEISLNSIFGSFGMLSDGISVLPHIKAGIRIGFIGKR